MLVNQHRFTVGSHGFSLLSEPTFGGGHPDSSGPTSSSRFSAAPAKKRRPDPIHAPAKSPLGRDIQHDALFDSWPAEGPGQQAGPNRTPGISNSFRFISQLSLMGK